MLVDARSRPALLGPNPPWRPDGSCSPPPPSSPAVQEGEDIVVVLPEHGFCLRFDAVQQRLRLVDVHDVTRLRVACGRGGAVFGGASNPPTFGGIYHQLGPTSSFARVDPATGLVPLHYPGALFLFPPGATAALGPASTPAAAAGGSGAGGGRAELPTALTTIAVRICIYAGAAGSVAAALASPPPPRAGGGWGPVEAVPGQGLCLPSGEVVRLGDSLQDLVAELGTPSATCAASELGSAAAAAGTAAGRHAYWLVYAERGLAALVDGRRHRVRKLLLHANLPSHPDFGLLHKCRFRCAAALPAPATPATVGLVLGCCCCCCCCC